MKIRNTSMDLLRIICMMMVVSMHYLGWGGLLMRRLLTFWLQVVYLSLVRVSVDCFFIKKKQLSERYLESV